MATYCNFQYFLSNFLWKILISSSIFLVRVHISLLYINILVTYALSNQILTSKDNLLLCSMYLYLWKDAMLSCFLLLISFSESNIEPKYLHVFQLSFPPLFTTYSSVLDLFTSKFLLSNVFGTDHLNLQFYF